VKRWTVRSAYVKEDPPRIIEAPSWFLARERAAIELRSSPSAVTVEPWVPEVRVKCSVKRKRPRPKPKARAGKKRGKRW